MKTNEKVSVCMATYNGAKYLHPQLESILIQLSDQDEVIISDDGSTDNTLDIISDLNDIRIKLYENTCNHGYTGNFYNAISKASGDYIFLSDQDDIWLPNKVKVFMQHLKEYDFVVSDAKVVDKDLIVINSSHFVKYNVKTGYINNLVRSRYLGCCMAFNRNVIRKILPPPSYKNSYPHDLWIALIAEKYFNTCLINEPLLLYRRHGGNMSTGGENDRETGRSTLKKIIARWSYNFEVIRVRHR